MLDVIPPELLTSILGHTTKTDQLSSSLVCRRVQSVICSTKALKKKPDEIIITSKLVHPVTYEIGRIRMGIQKPEPLGKKRFSVTLKRNKKGRSKESVDTMEADELDEPSTSSDLPQLGEILSQCIHGSILTLSSVTISVALLDLLTSSCSQLHRVTTVSMTYCVFTDEEGVMEKLCKFLSKTFMETLTIEFCREEGTKRVICDELFDNLPHLERINFQERVQGKNGISEELVERWAATSAPSLINFRNVETAITVGSLRQLIESQIRTRRKYKAAWNFGTLRRNSDKEEIANLLLLSYPELNIMQHIDMFGQRHFKISHPVLEVVFTTTGC